jgi:deazaflavin-dependent oxidoreductase (nitroreductase family)
MQKRLEKLGWQAFNAFTKLHVAAYRASGGRIGKKFRGAPCCLVDHVGRKSGEQRTSPLIYTRDGDSVVLIASKGGHPKHPAWWINLRANPETRVQVGDERWQVRAREVSDEAERTRLWEQMVAVYPPYDDYQAKTDRKIPVILLERSEAA